MLVYIDTATEYREKLYDIGSESVVLFLESDIDDNCEGTNTFHLRNASKRITQSFEIEFVT
jgi:hypothetical protein